MAIQIQIRHGTAAQWISANPVLLVGEMGVELDTRFTKIGDGISNWNSLQYTEALTNTASFAFNANSSSYSITSSYSMNGGSGGGGTTLFTGSTYQITSSWAENTNNIQSNTAVDNYFPLWMTGRLTDTSSISVQNGINHYINGNTFPLANNFPALTVVQPDQNSFNIFRASGNINNYLQTAIKNFYGGTRASTDYIAESDDATETTNYVDLGINSSAWNYPPNGDEKPHDGYLVNTGGDFWIFPIDQLASIRLGVGNTQYLSASITINQYGASVTGSLSGSVFGTSSYSIDGDHSISSSYSNTSSLSNLSLLSLQSNTASLANTSSLSLFSNTASLANKSLFSDTASISTSSLSSSYIIPGATLYQVSGSNGYQPAYLEPYDYNPISQNYLPPYKEGRTFWDHRYNDWAWYAGTGSGATFFRMHLGKEVTVGVHNPYSFTLPRLSAVYIGSSSVVGQYQPDVYLAIADGTGQHANVSGIIRNDIPSGSDGFMIMEGVMHRTNMGSLNVGDHLWLSTTTPGGYTIVQPGQPYEQVSLGFCSEAGTLGSFICDRFVFPAPPNAYAGITSEIISTNHNDGTITFSTGSVNLFQDSTGIGIVTSYPLPSKTFNLITGSINYIVAEHSSSNTAQYTLTTDSTYANGINIVRVADIDIFYKGSGSWETHEFEIGVVGLALANRINNKDIRLYGFQRENGLTIFTTGSSGAFGITAGVVWYGPNSHVLGQTLSSDIVNTDTYHWVLSGSQWNQHTQSTYENLYYNDITQGLTPLSPLSWSVNFVYRLVTDPDKPDQSIVLSTQQFDNSTDADVAQPPPNLPPQISTLGMLVGRIIVQSGSFSPIIQSAFNTVFAASTVTNHNSLLGLQGGQGGEYYHLTQADYIGTGTGLVMRQNNPTASNIMHAPATPYHIPYWSINKTLTYTGSVQVYLGQYVLVNSEVSDPINPEALLVKQVNTTSENTIGAYSTVNDFSQIYNQNFSSGSNASTDIVATSNIGSQTSNYIDMGIGSSNYNDSRWPWVKPLDGYLEVQGGDLWLSTITNNKIRFAINNTSSVGYIDSTEVNVSGSLYGTSSYTTTPNSSLLAAGVVINPTYVDNGIGSITISTGSANLYADASGSTQLQKYNLNSASLSYNTSSYNIVVADYNNNNPIWRISTDRLEINYTSIVPTLYFANDGNQNVYLNFTTEGLSLANQLQERIQKINKFQVESGFALGEFGTRNISITSGSAWSSATRFIFSAFDSTVNKLSFYYHVASVWTSSIVTQYNNASYDNGVQLVGLGNKYYGVNYIFRVGNSNDAAYILGQQYSSLTAAESDKVPSIPPQLADTSVLVGRIIVQKNSNTAAAIESAFNNLFAPSGIINHNELSGLQGGSVDEYYHLIGSEYTASTAGTGPFVRQNNPQISGALITGSIFGTASYASNSPATTLFTASTYQITSSWSISSSWSPNQGATTLSTGSTYQITSSWSNNSLISNVSVSSSFASQSISSSYAPEKATFLFTGSTYQITASQAVSASWVPGGSSGTTLFTGSTYQITSSWTNNILSTGISGNIYALSSSWASSSISSSYAPEKATFLFTGSIYQITSSWSNNALISNVSISSSWASSSISSSYALNSPSTTLFTGSTYQITSSWSINSSTSSFITASNIVGIVTSASYSRTASYIGMPIKSGIIQSQSFSTGNPRTASVVFTKPFVDNSYSVAVIGNSARTWLVQNVLSGSFTINSNSSVALTGSTYWQAIYQGEYN